MKGSPNKTDIQGHTFKAIMGVRVTLIGRSKVRVLPGPPFIPLLGIADS